LIRDYNLNEYARSKTIALTEPLSINAHSRNGKANKFRYLAQPILLIAIYYEIAYNFKGY